MSPTARSCRSTSTKPGRCPALPPCGPPRIWRSRPITVSPRSTMHSRVRRSPPTACASSAKRSPSSSPRRWPRGSTPPRRCWSTSICSTPWSIPNRRCRTRRRCCSTIGRPTSPSPSRPTPRSTSTRFPTSSSAGDTSISAWRWRRWSPTASPQSRPTTAGSRCGRPTSSRTTCRVSWRPCWASKPARST